MQRSTLCAYFDVPEHARAARLSSTKVFGFHSRRNEFLTLLKTIWSTITSDPDISDFLGGNFGPRGMQVTTSSGEQAYKYSGAASPSKHVWICGVPRTRHRAIPFSPNSESSMEMAAAASRHRGKKKWLKSLPSPVYGALVHIMSRIRRIRPRREPHAV